jgi:hypothetical protein
MKMVVATRMMAAVVALAAVSPVSGFAAEGAWDANYACQVTSPERGDAPRVTLSISRKGEVGGELRAAVRFRLFNIPQLSEGEKVAFADTVVEIPGFANWTGIKSDGRQEKSGYALYIPLPDIAQVVGPMEGGRVLKVTVKAKDGLQTFEVDLTGSSKAIASFRVCST